MNFSLSSYKPEFDADDFGIYENDIECNLSSESIDSVISLIEEKPSIFSSITIKRKSYDDINFEKWLNLLDTLIKHSTYCLRFKSDHFLSRAVWVSNLITSTSLIEKITRIEFHNFNIDEKSLELIKPCAYLENIKELYFFDCKLDLRYYRSEHFFDELSDSYLISNLQSLHFSGYECNIRDKELISLSEWPALENLTKLTIKDGLFSDEGVRAIIRSRHLINLENLCIEGGKISSYSADDFRKSRLANLKHLSAIHWHTHPCRNLASILTQAISKNRKIKQLASLNLECSINQEDIRFLDNIKYSKLTALNLNHNPRIAKQLPKTNELKHFSSSITSLRLNGLRMGDNIFIKWLSSIKTKNLKELQISDNKLTDKSIDVLLKSPLLRSLIFLNLEDNNISENKLLQLLSSPNSKSIQRLEIPTSNFTEHSEEYLKKWCSNICENLPRIRLVTFSHSKYDLKLSDQPSYSYRKLYWVNKIKNDT